MNIQEYISSGIVESYVLRLANPEESAEFERMCAAHSEIREARESFEISLEQQAMLYAVIPSKNIKSKIFAEIEIENEKIDKNIPDTSTLHASTGSGTQAPVKELRIGWQRYLAAASIALLVISAALNFYLFNRYKDYSNRYSILMAQQTELAKNNDVMRTRLNTYENTLAMLKDPAMQIIKMPGTNVPGSPDSNSVATVYWNMKSRDVYLLINNLPQPSLDQQYQLWAIVDGKPVDAGVFDVNDITGVLRMKNIPRAQVFAVTLEKRGGSLAPSGPMYVLGKVS